MAEQCEVFMEIVAMADRLGATPLNKHKEPWVHHIGKYWTIALNATSEEKEFTPESTMGHKIKPFSADIYFNGWWVGEANLYQGHLTSMDNECTEALLLDAIRREPVAGEEGRG
jgi:hypothetical protein